MMLDFSSGKFWSMFSFSATNDQVCGFNITNETFCHEDYDKFSYCYKRAIISGDVCLINCGGGSK